MTHYYFAYGSNISSARIKKRCESARFLMTAYMNHHTLCFPQHRLDGALVAGYKKDLDKKLWGAIYEISTEEDLVNLDKAEDFKSDREKHLNSYLKLESIELFDLLDKKIELDIFVYLHNKEQDAPAKNGFHSQEYLSHIMTGYKEYGLDKIDEATFKVMEKLVEQILLGDAL